MRPEAALRMRWCPRRAVAAIRCFSVAVRSPRRQDVVAAQLRARQPRSAPSVTVAPRPARARGCRCAAPIWSPPLEPKRASFARASTGPSDQGAADPPQQRRIGAVERRSRARQRTVSASGRSTSTARPSMICSIAPRRDVGTLPQRDGRSVSTAAAMSGTRRSCSRSPSPRPRAHAAVDDELVHRATQGCPRSRRGVGYARGRCEPQEFSGARVAAPSTEAGARAGSPWSRTRLRT